MELKIVLDSRKLVKIPETLVAGQKVVVAFESSIYALGLLAVVVTNGVKTKPFVLEGDNTLDITEFCENGGRVDIKAELIVNGHTVKEWRLEPLVIREIDTIFEPISQIDDFADRLSRMENIIVEFNKKINESM